MSDLQEYTGDILPIDESNKDISFLKSRITGVESGGDTEAVSPQGATGSMQIMPDTFKQYARPGESFDNDSHRRAAAIRKIIDDYQYFNGDVAKAAAAYIGGRGAVRKDGTIRDDVKDAWGTTPASYVDKVLGASDMKPYDGEVIPVGGAGYGRGKVNPTAEDTKAAVESMPKPYKPGIIDSIGDAMNSIRDYATGANDRYVGNAGRGSSKDERRLDNVSVGDAASRGLQESAASLGKTVGLAIASPAVALEAIWNATPWGNDDHPISDAVFKQFVGRYDDIQKDNAIKPDENAGVGGKVAFSLGAMIPDMAVLLGSGGATAAQQAGVTIVPEAINAAKMVSNALEHSASTMKPLIVKSATDAAQRVYEAGGSKAEAVNEALIASGKTVLAGATPLAQTGNIASRIATNIGVGALQYEAERGVHNVIHPDQYRERDIGDMAASAASTGVLGVMGHNAERYKAPDRIDLGYAPDTQKTSGASAVDLAYGESRRAPWDVASKEAQSAVLDSNSVDEAAAVAKNSLPKVTVDTNVDLSAIRPIDSSLQDRIAKAEFDDLHSKANGFINEDGVQVEGVPLDVNEQKRYAELKSRFAPTDGSGEALPERQPGVLGDLQRDVSEPRTQGAWDAAREEWYNKLTAKGLDPAEARKKAEADFPKAKFSDLSAEDSGMAKTLGDLLSSMTGIPREQILFGSDSKFGNGVSFPLGGKDHLIVNFGSPELPVSSTGWHEVNHVLQRMARAADEKGFADTPAQRYRDRIDNLFSEFTQAGREEYVREFLHKQQVEKIAEDVRNQNQGLPKEQVDALVDQAVSNYIKKHASTDHTLEEMQSDFLGRSMHDKAFIDRMAKADPIGFKKFAQKWLAFIQDMIDNAKHLLGTDGKGAQSKRIYAHVKDLEAAHKIVESALISLREPVKMSEHSDGTVSFHGDYDAIADALRSAGISKVIVSKNAGSVRVGKAESELAKDLYNSGVMMSKKDYNYEETLPVKFERISRFSKDYQSLVDRIKEDARKGIEGAAVMRLIARTGFRIGSVGRSGGEPTFGASSLKPEHVTINGDTVTFNFRGKSGVQQVHSIIDPEIARDLESRMDREFLFKIADRAVRKYHDSILDGKDYKVHDYRTYAATDAAKKVVESLPQPKDANELKAFINLAADEAARKIGDDRATALKSYIDPGIFDGWKRSLGIEQGSHPSNGEGKDRVAQARDGAANAGSNEPALRPAEDRQSIDDSGVRHSTREVEAGPSGADIDRLNRLGSFDIDADYGKDLDGLEVSELSKEDMKKIEAELFGSVAPSTEVHPVVKNPISVDYSKTDPKVIKKNGLFAEDAYPDIQYGKTKEIDYGTFGNEGHVTVGGSSYKLRLMPDGHSRTQSFPMGAYDKLSQDLQYGKAFSDLKLSPEQARAWNKRNMAAIDLFARRHDLYTAVPADARSRVLETWKKIADTDGAFTFNKDVTAQGSDTIAKIQSVADSLLDGTGYKAYVEKMGHGWVDIQLVDKKGNTGVGQMEYVASRGGSYFTLHAQHFNQGSSLGKPFYQVAQAAADALGVPIKADAQGLLGVNNYRRTEQQFSSAARTGRTMTEPGSGQRIYGWNYKPKNQEQHDRNFVRLALAGARNVAEFFPEIKELRYDLANDKFTTLDGKDAELDVKAALANKDMREMSMSRSTLARAAITFGAIRGDAVEADSIKSPVMYSAKEDPKLKRWAEDVSAGRKVDPGFVIAQEPHQALQMFGVGRSAPVVLQSNIVRHLENKGRMGEVITASDISKIPDMLRNPRAVIDRTGTPSGDFAIIGNDRDKDGNPLLIGIKKAQLSMGRQTMNITDVRTLFGKSESLSFVLRNIKDGNRVWMPEKEIARVRDFTGEEPISYGTNGAAPPRTSAVPNAASSAPLQRKASEVSQATAPNVYSDRALVKSKAGGKEWTLLREPLNISDADVGRASGVAFSRKDDLLQSASDLVSPVLNGVYEAVAPMSAGSDRSRAMAQKWINNVRAAQYGWQRIDKHITDNFTPEQREKMWNAADEQNELLQRGEDTTGKGLDRLTPEERTVVDQLHAYGEELLQRAKDVGLFKGEGVPYWTPRVMAMVSAGGGFEKPTGDKTAGQSKKGANLSTNAQSLKGRRYLTSEESEEAMTALGGALVRDIRTMPMQMSQLEKAVASRELINQVRDIGKATGEDFVNSVGGEGYFTLDHPAFKVFTPGKKLVALTDQELADKGMYVDDGKVYRQLKDGSAVELKSYHVQDNGIVVKETPDWESAKESPLYIKREFKGPLDAVLSESNGKVYNGYMLLKSKAMSAIMYSPLIHNQVILGRVLAYGGLKTPWLYRFGRFSASSDKDFMSDMIRHGMVPIGSHNNMIDVGDIANDQLGIKRQGSWTDPNESWIALAGQKALNAAKDGAGDKFKSAVDEFGDFWHNTLLWRRIGDVQANIAKDAYDRLRAKGISDEVAMTAAAHLANRYAGAIGRENMSQATHKILNVLLFSKSFNMGNLGTVKDAFNGLPAGLKSVMREANPKEAEKVEIWMRSKARRGLLLDAVFAYGITSIVQSIWNDYKDLDDVGYIQRLKDMSDKIKENPTSISSYDPRRLTPMWTNQANKRDRVNLGVNGDGVQEYMRLPTGKVIEDIIKAFSHPIELVRDKLSPFARAVIYGSQGVKDPFGTPITDPNGTTMKKVADMAKFIVGTHMPVDQIELLKDAMYGHATELDKSKLLGNVTGLSVSRGHPRGPEGFIADQVEERMTNAKKYLHEIVKHDVKMGDPDKAVERMMDAGFTQKEASSYVRRIMNPRASMTPAQRKKFLQHANEEESAQMDVYQ